MFVGRENVQKRHGEEQMMREQKFVQKLVRWLYGDVTPRGEKRDHADK